MHARLVVTPDTIWTAKPTGVKVRVTAVEGHTIDFVELGQNTTQSLHRAKFLTAYRPTK